MRNSVDNQNAYEYNKAINQDIKTICQPLVTNFGVTEVAYHRIYNNGEAISVGTNSEILKHYFFYVQEKGLFFQKHLNKIQENKFFYFLWPNKVENNLHGIIKQIGVWNGFNLYIKHKDFIENFVFMSSPNSSEMQNYCINNLGLVNSFVGYFKDKAHDFIYNMDKKNMAFFNCSSSLINPYDKAQNFSSFYMKKIPFYLRDHKIYLTNREAMCFSFISFGYSNKEIALILNISPRTVEVFIASVKMKSNITCKSKLIDLINFPENATIKNFRYLLEKKIEI
ncbi:MAG: LuxR C-terminal-related transcriptional regulator [Rickettsiales bacterium]